MPVAPYKMYFGLPARLDTSALPWRLLLWDDDAGLWRDLGTEGPAGPAGPAGADAALSLIFDMSGSVLIDAAGEPITV